MTSTEVAYFSYIYSVIPVEYYQRATSYVRSALLAGYTFGAGLGQMLVSLAGRASWLKFKISFTCKHNKMNITEEIH